MSSQTDFASRSPISHSHLPCFAVRTLVSLWYSWPGSCQPCWKPSEQIYLVSHLIKECASIINKAFLCTLAQFNLLILCQRASRGIFFFLAGIHKSWHQHSVLHTVWAVAEHLISTQKLCAKSSFKVLFVQVVLGLFCNFWLLWKCVPIIFPPWSSSILFRLCELSVSDCCIDFLLWGLYSQYSISEYFECLW